MYLLVLLIGVALVYYLVRSRAMRRLADRLGLELHRHFDELLASRAEAFAPSRGGSRRDPPAGKTRA